MSLTLIKKLREQRNAAWKAATEILDKAEAEGRELSTEESESWRKANADVDAFATREQELVDAELRQRDAEDTYRKLDARPAERGAPNPDGVLEDVRSFLRGEKRAVDIAKDTTFRDLVKGTPAAGGVTVQATLYGQLMEHLIEVSGLMQGVPTMIETDSGETIDIPVTTAFSTAGLTAEAAAIAESDPAFAKRSLGAYKYAFLTQISRELIDDSAFDLQGFLARQGGRGVGNALGAHLIAGTGINQPAGLATLATVGVTSATGVAGAFTTENLIDLFYSVIAPYRNSASAAWLMKDQTLAAVRKLKDTTGQYIWQPSLQIGAPDTLLGKAVRTDPNVASVAINATSVLFGDVSTYFVRLAGGIRFERSDDFAFANDLVTFKTVIRGDGVLADQTGAVKAFKGAAS